MDDDSTLAPLLPRKISKASLKVGQKLGEGGVAIVHEANDADGQRVALRQLRPSLRFKFDAKRRFVKGIEVRRSLGRHPNIVHYIAEGSTFMQPFEVIELVPGDSLRHLITGKHDCIWREPLWILRQCAAAIIHIHNSGLFHLDIKSENFLVTMQRGRPTVKLSDFDLCQPTSSTSAPAGLGGSKAYLPPEYLVGKKLSLGVDIFAFGVMAYNLYTFSMPFVGSCVESADANGNYEVKFPAEAAARMDGDLQAFIRKCLAPKPEERYGDGYQLFLALEELHKREMKRRRGPEKGPPRPGVSLS